MEAMACDFGDQVIKGASPPCSLRSHALGEANYQVVRTLQEPTEGRGPRDKRL